MGLAGQLSYRVANLSLREGIVDEPRRPATFDRAGGASTTQRPAFARQQELFRLNSGSRHALNRVRYSCGVTASSRKKLRRIVSSEPKPQR
jgi:hypothetical protein